MKYIIYGAGAIGGAVGGRLYLSGKEVVFVARKHHVENIMDHGFRLDGPYGDDIIHLKAVEKVDELDVSEEDVVLLAVKSQDTEVAVEELHRAGLSDNPIVCLQNGVRNEEVASRRFSRVYGGSILIGSVFLYPGKVTWTALKPVFIGVYPEGIDDLSRKIASDLSAAGFYSHPYHDIMTVKYMKLVLNTGNAPLAITDYSEQSADKDEILSKFMAGGRREAIKVLNAAGIFSYREDVNIAAEILKLFGAGEDELTSWAGEAWTAYASTWQDTYLRRNSTEVRFFNGEIVELGKKFGISTPYNQVSIEVLEEIMDEQLEQGAYSPEDLLVRLKELEDKEMKKV